MFSWQVLAVIFATIYSLNAYVITSDDFLEETEPQPYIRSVREIGDDLDDELINYETLQESNLDHHPRVRRQVFGGISQLPGGGRTQTFGGNVGPAWGSLSQSFDTRGVGTPITYSGGIGHISPAGHGISGSIAAQPGIGAQGNFRGQLGLFNTPNHQVTAWGQHDRNFNKDFKPIGPATNSVGLNYLNNNNGAGAFISGSQTPGFPKTASVGGNFPLINKANTRLDATAQSNFVQGMKPDNRIGLLFKKQF